ncbi:helix-turn-helix transcriptional regulator [Bradyrhizobium sp. 26S5]|uniref:helix-turn-helix domain-containing protein n=1 Tax=Bradyrhizobium sp. 26S5 TaxID=3139729 RepID=UPI0030D08E2F
MEVTGAQIRAARAFLKWTIADLAKAADVGISSIQVIEANDGPPTIKGGGVETTLDHRATARAEVVKKIERALIDAGITFLPASAQGNGIRGRTKDAERE